MPIRKAVNHLNWSLTKKIWDSSTMSWHPCLLLQLAALRTKVRMAMDSLLSPISATLFWRTLRKGHVAVQSISPLLVLLCWWCLLWSGFLDQLNSTKHLINRGDRDIQPSQSTHTDLYLNGINWTSYMCLPTYRQILQALNIASCVKPHIQYPMPVDFFILYQ
jgi:hypothetical protein